MTTSKIVGAVLAATLLLTACGGDDDTAAPATDTPAEAVSGHDDATEVGAKTCSTAPDATPDASFEVEVAYEPDPPKVEGTTIRVTVTRDGQPVTGAEVCIRADMTEMTHAGVKATAKAAEPGVYTHDTTWGMRGAWDGAARVIVDDEVVVVPIQVIVT